MKKSYLLLLLLGFCTLLNSACGSVSTSSGSDSTSTATVSGQVNLGTISTSGFKAASLKSFTSDDNYFLWIQNRGTKKVYFVDINADGSFTLDIGITEGVADGDNFFAALIRKDPLEYLGPITLSTGSAGTEMSTGMVVSGNISGLVVNFDLAKQRGQIDPSLVSTLSKDDECLVRLLNAGGMPVGAGNAGKGGSSQTSTLVAKNTIDKDQDGIPDMFDAMNNGAKLDNAVANTEADMVAHTSKISKAIMFTNLKIDKSQASTYTVTSNAILTLEVQPVNASNVTSVKALYLNTNYQACTVLPLPGGFTGLETVPASGSLWSADSYKLYKATNQSSNTVWTVLLTPQNNNFNPGQLILVEITYSDSTKDYCWMSINFKFQNIISDTTVWASGLGTPISPYVVPASGDVTLTYTAPKDETGSDLADLTYSFELFFYDSSNNQIGTQKIVSIGKDTFTGTLSAADLDQFDSLNPAYVQVDITARYPYGDNTATKVYLKRSDW